MMKHHDPSCQREPHYTAGLQPAGKPAPRKRQSYWAIQSQVWRSSVQLYIMEMLCVITGRCAVLKRVTGRSNKNQLNKQNWTKPFEQMLILPKLICPKAYLTILQIEQSTNWTDSNSPNFIYTICSLNRFELTKKHIEQCKLNMILFSWPLYNFKEDDYHNWSKPQWIQTTINPSHRGEGCNKFLHARGAQRPRGVGDLAPWPKAREIWAKPAPTRSICSITVCSINYLMNLKLFKWDFVQVENYLTDFCSIDHLLNKICLWNWLIVQMTPGEFDQLFKWLLFNWLFVQ